MLLHPFVDLIIFLGGFLNLVVEIYEVLSIKEPIHWPNGSLLWYHFGYELYGLWLMTMGNEWGIWFSTFMQQWKWNIMTTIGWILMLLKQIRCPFVSIINLCFFGIWWTYNQAFLGASKTRICFSWWTNNVQDWHVSFCVV